MRGKAGFFSFLSTYSDPEEQVPGCISELAGATVQARGSPCVGARYLQHREWGQKAGSSPHDLHYIYENPGLPMADRQSRALEPDTCTSYLSIKKRRKLSVP